MSSSILSGDLDYLQGQFCDRITVYPMQDWSPALLAAVIALLDLHFAEGGTNKAPVLELVRR
jgi:hypothetical protein